MVLVSSCPRMLEISSISSHAWNILRPQVRFRLRFLIPTSHLVQACLESFYASAPKSTKFSIPFVYKSVPHYRRFRINPHLYSMIRSNITLASLLVGTSRYFPPFLPFPCTETQFSARCGMNQSKSD